MTVNKPYTFSSGEILSDEVNANFDELYDALNNDYIDAAASIAFTNIPSGPSTDPTTDNHLVRKKYVDDLNPAPQAYTPNHNGTINVSGGTEIARVTYRGKLVHVSYSLVSNGTSTFTNLGNGIEVGLPTAVAGAGLGGAGELRDGGTRSYPITVTAAPGATRAFVLFNGTGNQGRVNGSNPFTWGANLDALRFTATYERA